MIQRLQSRLGIVENVHIVVADAQSGLVRQAFHTHNKIPTAGLNLVRDVLLGAQAIPSHVAVGTTTAAPAATDTALGNEVHRNTLTQRVPSAQQILWTFFLPATAGNGHTLREAAIMNSSSTGGEHGTAATVLSRVVHDPIVKTVSLTVTYYWTHTFAETT